MRIPITINLIFLILISTCSFAQNVDWKFLRSANTGMGGDFVQTIEVDRFGNKWTGGYMPFWSEGSVARFNDTVWTNWSNIEGYLPADRVYDVAFDNYDGLWVATNGVGYGIDHGGISHYDGTTWATYTTSNSPLPADDMRGICVDNNNNVWATFHDVTNGQGGVSKFDGSTWTIYTPANSNLPSYDVDKIDVDAQNNIYIGCNLGLIKFDGLNWILFTTSNSGISNNNVTDVEYDASTGKIYTATGAAVDIYDGTDWTHFNSSNSPLSSSGIWSVDARNDSMIVTTIGGSYLTYIFDGANWITHPEMDHTYDSRIDLQGNFWICGIGFIEKYDGNSWTTYTRYNTGLTSYFMNSVFVDSKDRKWFGVSDNGGISMFDCPVWEDYGAWNSGLWPAPITMATSGTSATEDTFGNVWMSYYAGGIVKIPEGDVHNYPAWVTWQAGAVPNATCKLIAADNSGDVWAEGGCGLAIRYDHVTGEWIQYNLYDMGLPCGSNNYMYSIKPNPNNNEVWFCTQAGIAIYDAGTWTIKSQSNGGLPFQGEYYDVAFDSQNNAWVASDDGLIKLTGATWTIYNESNSPLIANHINSLTIDADNLLYLSTSNVTTFPYCGGINTFDGMNNWQSYAYGSSPLPHYQLGQVALDKLGNLWINSASEGVIIFNSNGVQGWECIDTSLETGIATGIVSVGNELSTIAKCYPNPFLSTTTFEFNLAKTGNVSISIADITGREVKKIVTQNLPAGNNKAVADLSELESGIYICIIKAGEKIQTIKLVKN